VGRDPVEVAPDGAGHPSPIPYAQREQETGPIEVQTKDVDAVVVHRVPGQLPSIRELVLRIHLAGQRAACGGAVVGQMQGQLVRVNLGEAVEDRAHRLG
jgi:hypothetical protein